MFECGIGPYINLTYIVKILETFVIKYPKLKTMLNYQSSFTEFGTCWQLSYIILIGFLDFSQLLVGAVLAAPEPV